MTYFANGAQGAWTSSSSDPPFAALSAKFVVRQAPGSTVFADT
ncbi:hypothetical protein ACH40F_35755 [Streptomyces sp. NPDC020794]